MGGLAARASIAVMPSDHTSHRASYRPLEMTSGAIQCGVPMTDERFEAVELSCAATPKSASLTWQSELSSRLADLMSRCMMPPRFWPCRNSSPVSASRHAAPMAASSRHASVLRMTSRIEPKSHSSIAIQRQDGFGNAPNARTINGLTQRCISLSSFRMSLEISFGPHGRIFTATVPCLTVLALQTTP